MSEALRLLLVTKSTGGVAEYVRHLVGEHGLDRDAFQITVACLSENGPEFAAELSRLAGVKAFSLKMNRYHVDPLSDAQVLFALAAHLRRERYDLVHAHASKPGFLVRLAAIGTHTPVLYSPHSFAFHAGAGQSSALVVATLERLAARYLTTRIVAIADAERKLARKFHVGTDDLFVTVHTGLDPQPYRVPVDVAALKLSLGVPASAHLVGSVGRLSRQKAPLDFVRMAAILHQRMPGTHFIWIGSGPLESDAHQLSADLGLNAVLHFAGQRNDVPELLQTLDCFVLSSLWEGFPLVLLEAMAAGVPVVATDIPGNDEAVRSGVDGLLVYPGNVMALAESVQGMLNAPLQADAFRHNARQRLEQEFSQAAMLQGLTTIYQQVVFMRRAVPVGRVPRKESL